jgi:hypothetical protein
VDEKVREHVAECSARGGYTGLTPCATSG